MTVQRLCLSIFCLLLPSWAAAGGPWLIRDGNPLRWRATSPIVLNLDLGGLGELTQAEAEDLVQFAVDQWTGVATASVELSIGAPLSADIEGLDEVAFNDFVTTSDGTNPVIFDATGEIFVDIFGAQNGVIGIAGISLVSTLPGDRIVKGFAMLNGENATTGNLEVFRATCVHELGHLLNLDHAQINGLRRGVTIPSFPGTASVLDVETMFPILVGSSATPHPMATLHHDDRSALSALYPTSGFASSTGTIRGSVLDVDGATPLQGVNVIARNVADPFVDAVSYVSGQLESSPPAPSPPAPLSRRGEFDLQGLTPGATYRVYIEEISNAFTMGSGVGPVDPPLDLDPSSSAAFLEFYNGASEGPLNPPDDPLEAEDLLLMNPGDVLSEVNISINNSAQPLVIAVDPDSGSYLSTQGITVTGENFQSPIDILLSGPEPTLLTPFVAVDSSTLTTTVPAGVMPGVYDIIVETPQGESDPGAAAYTVTEPAPTLTGSDPVSFANYLSQEVTFFGTHFLGVASARLATAGLPDVDLTILQVHSAGSILVEAPPEIPPGVYDVFVTNTTAESAAGTTLTVTSGGQLTGDCNQDGGLDLSDAVCLLGHFFSNSPVFLPCGDGTVSDPGNLSLLNVNADVILDLSDAVYLLGFLFNGGPPPVQGTQCQGVAGCPAICAF